MFSECFADFYSFEKCICSRQKKAQPIKAELSTVEKSEGKTDNTSWINNGKNSLIPFLKSQSKMRLSANIITLSNGWLASIRGEHGRRA